MANEKRHDLIDRDAVIAELQERQTFLVNGWGYRDEYTRGLIEAVDKIANQPTVDAVEVVRCKDCKKWEYDENFSGWCVEWRRRTLGDHFCSYGERREGDI